jgi:hypothetical protein
MWLVYVPAFLLVMRHGLATRAPGGARESKDCEEPGTSARLRRA